MLWPQRACLESIVRACVVRGGVEMTNLAAGGMKPLGINTGWRATAIQIGCKRHARLLKCGSSLRFSRNSVIGAETTPSGDNEQDNVISFMLDRSAVSCKTPTGRDHSYGFVVASRCTPYSAGVP